MVAPWDLEQTFATIAPYTVEEAYEVADAIERGSLSDLKEELGDLLLQVVFHSRMAQEQGAFAFDDVADAISEKMIRRHPHVFGPEDQRTSAEQTRAWEVIKAKERARQGQEQEPAGRRPRGPACPHARREADGARRARGLRLARSVLRSRQAARGDGRARTRDRSRPAGAVARRAGRHPVRMREPCPQARSGARGRAALDQRKVRTPFFSSSRPNWPSAARPRQTPTCRKWTCFGTPPRRWSERPSGTPDQPAALP
jgi:NTP pyrophosphatase (non-canonical NTP hydrolase)